LRYESAAIWR